MATVHVSVARVTQVTQGGYGQPLYSGSPIVAASLTTSGTAASTSTLSAAIGTQGNGNGVVARISSIDANHYVCIGGTASATTGYFVPTGTYIEIVTSGGEVSAITA